MQATKYKRIMLAISGESLLGEKKAGVDLQAVKQLAEEIKTVYTQHVQIAIAIGGKNIFNKQQAYSEGFDRTTADYIAMLATVMNGLALQDELEKMGVPTRVQSTLQMPAVAESFVRRKAIRHMEKGRVIILCAGTGVPFVSSDTGATLHALELRCDIILRTSKVSGIYNQDPESSLDARQFKTLNSKEAIEMQQSGVIDISSLSMAHKNNLPIMVFALLQNNNLERAVRGENVGTLIASDVETELVL